MRVVIVGATGVVGRQLVPLPIGAGHEAVALSREPGPERVEVRTAALGNWFPALAAPSPRRFPAAPARLAADA
ncbi:MULTISPECIES: hypothetical protein [unclassified Streptomyces]|uniref:hypothetical protein n=1 Tax=unclassified Streptomyces TaxID=2593676 RepID=UPI002E2A81B4|nr:hypothetical protein [Streptomyces sp. NBC_00223]